MVDFKKLRRRSPQNRPIEPRKIFDGLPRPAHLRDLYSSQESALQDWFNRRDEGDLVLKLHTGTGKTLVGLLACVSTLNELSRPALYLAPTKQLAEQSLAGAADLGIPGCLYKRTEPIDARYSSGDAILFATYHALFNGNSKFGTHRREPSPLAKAPGIIVLDDAHAAVEIVRNQFSIEIKKGETYDSLCGLFRADFREQGTHATLDDIVSGAESDVLDVPHFAWTQKQEAVLAVLQNSTPVTKSLEWPLIRDRLPQCHALVSTRSFTITPIVPFVDQLPAFSDCGRRLFLSATLNDDSALIRTFGTNRESASNPISAHSSHVIGQRLILAPSLMPFRMDATKFVKTLATKWKDSGVAVLTPSDKCAKKWEDVADVPNGSSAVEAELQRFNVMTGEPRRPLALSNRYDGIDMPGDVCRILIIDGLPFSGTDYNRFRSRVLRESEVLNRQIAQRLEQGMGRSSRGYGDYSVVILIGDDLSAWISARDNRQLMTSATRIQMDIGASVSEAITSGDEFIATANRCINQDAEWVRFHNEEVSDSVECGQPASQLIDAASFERRAIALWLDGRHETALGRILEQVRSSRFEPTIFSSLVDVFARIASDAGDEERAEKLANEAFQLNRHLLRPPKAATRSRLSVPGEQAVQIGNRLKDGRTRRAARSQVAANLEHLNPTASASQFEESLKLMGEALGFQSERHDRHGDGPDVAWVLPNRAIWLFEAKSRKKASNPLTKGEHGQLLVAAQWAKEHHPSLEATLVSINPVALAQPAAYASDTMVMTMEKVSELVIAVRTLYERMAEMSVMNESQTQAEAQRLLEELRLTPALLRGRFLLPFRNVSYD